MTTNYKPALADVVRATLGDNVLYGKIAALPASGDIGLKIEDSKWIVNIDGYEWTFEPWTPPVVFKPLAVVRLAVDSPKAMYTYWSSDDDRKDFDAPKVVYRQEFNDWYDLSSEYEFTSEEIAAAIAAGKAEVLFEGVDL